MTNAERYELLEAQLLKLQRLRGPEEAISRLLEEMDDLWHLLSEEEQKEAYERAAALASQELAV